MLLKKTFIFVLFLTSLAIFSFAESFEGLPIHVKEIADNTIRIWAGDHISTTAVTAIGTSKGIVVIDTTRCPALDKKFKEIISKKLNRNDFKYLINTHGHSDHTNGNSVYNECEIIAHKETAELIKRNLADQKRMLDFFSQEETRIENNIGDGKYKGEELKRVKEDLLIKKMNKEVYSAGLKPAYPTKTFDENMTLGCGDTTFELYAAGGTHTETDIFIFIPEKGLLFTGDMMADKWLTNSPGCLAAFAIRSGTKDNLPVLMKNYKAMVVRRNQIELIVPGHWNGEISTEGFVSRYNYLKKTITDVSRMAKEGKKINQVIREYTLADHFPHLAESPGFNYRNHAMSLVNLWRMETGMQSASNYLNSMVQNGSFKDEFDQFAKNLIKGQKEFFILESDMNSLGYRLIHQQKMEEAIAVLSLNTKIYPDSWNVFDSLAEAYYIKGDKRKALQLYEKSLDLNPDSPSGKEFVRKIKSELE